MSVRYCHYFRYNNPEGRGSHCYLLITLHTRKQDLNLGKKLAKCCIWSIAFCGAENWTFRKVDQRHPAIFEMWCWRRAERIIRTDNVRSDDVFQRDKKRRRRRKGSWVGQIFRRNCLPKHVIERKLGGRVELKENEEADVGKQFLDGT